MDLKTAVRNFVHRFEKDKVSIPGKVMRIPRDYKAHSVAVKYPYSAQMHRAVEEHMEGGIDRGILPRYYITVNGNNTRLVGEVYISSDRLTSRKPKGLYRVRVAFQDYRNTARTIKDSLIGERKELIDADHLAHRTALDIADEIASANNLGLEILSARKIEELEEEGLAQKIGGLHPRRPISRGHLKLLTVFIIFSFGGVILSIFSLSTTGNVISNLTGTTQGLLGIFLFVFGLAGLAFSRK